MPILKNCFFRKEGRLVPVFYVIIKLTGKRLPKYSVNGTSPFRIFIKNDMLKTYLVHILLKNVFLYGIMKSNKEGFWCLIMNCFFKRIV